MYGQYIKAKFFKNNTIKNNVIKIPKPSKSMPSLFAYHGPSTAFRVRNGVLGNTLPRFTVFLPMVQPLGHRRYDICHLLASKTPCKSYTSRNKSKQA